MMRCINNMQQFLLLRDRILFECFLARFKKLGYGLACVIDIMCNTLSGTGAGFLTGGGGLLFQAYDIASFCDIEVKLF